MLRGCMIDGFGWFEPADYRRSWLFFDEVDHVLPARVAGLLAYPDDLARRRPECAVVTPSVEPSFVEALADAAARDADDPSFRALVERAPAKDLEYSSLVLLSDVEVRGRADMLRLADPVFATSMLVNKLLAYAAVTGTVPIVGRRYAQAILRHKLELWASERAASVGTTHGVTCAAFAAGLSLDFVSDEALAAAPFDALVRFKDGQRDLLDRSQLSLLDVASRFRALPDGPQFESELRALREGALGVRDELDDGARSAFLRSGLGVGVQTALAVAAGVVTALAVTRGVDLSGLLPGALAAAAVGGLGAVAGPSPAGKARSPRAMLYVHALERFLSPWAPVSGLRAPRSASKLSGPVPQVSTRADVQESWDVFLCHAGADADAAEELYEALSPTCRVFLDSRCLRLGEAWPARLSEAQVASKLTVVLVGPGTSQAYYQQEEIAAAIQLANQLGRGHRVVPVYFGLDPRAAGVPYGLRVLHGLRVGTGGLAKAAGAIAAMLAVP